MLRNRLFSLVCLLLLAAAPSALAAGFGDPRGFLANETVVEKPLYPGVVWYEVRGWEGGQPQVAHVVRADLSQPHLGLKALPGDRLAGGSQFFRRSTVSQLQSDNDAFVSINTAFFDIRDTMAPTGLLMRDKMLLREPVGSGNVLLFNDAGIPRVTTVSSTNRILHGGASRYFQGMNANTIGANGINVYQLPWERSPGTTAGFTPNQVTEVLVERTDFIPPSSPQTSARLRGRVLQVRQNQGSVEIKPNQFVITAAGSSRSFLQGMAVNSTVEVEWRLHVPAEPDWNTVSQGVGGGSLLVRNDQVQSENRDHWNARHPRSSIGVNADRTEIILVLVEGRQQGRAAGMSLHALAAWHHHMGSRDALEFDGGGSSSIVARVDGMNTRLNRPSDGSERFVPAGLGVVLVEEPPISLFRNIRVASGGDEAVLTWETAVPTVSYAKFGKVNLDRTTARDSRMRKRHAALLTDLAGERFYARVIAELNGQVFQSPLIEIPVLGDVSVVVDDTDAQFTGSWTFGEYPTPWERGYRWTNTVTGNPTHTATFRPNLPVSGRYDVYAWYVQGSNRPTDARHQVFHRDGMHPVSVNQQTGGSQWRLLAENLPFAQGSTHFVRVINQSSIAGRALMADAIQWVLRSVDRDPDEVPNWWLEHFFGSDLPDLASDPDGDGATVAEEFLWGTDPTDPESRFRIGLEREGPEWTLTFSPFQEGRTYRLRESADLASGSWETVSGAAPVRLETGEGQFRVPVPSGAGRRFYRVEVSR